MNNEKEWEEFWKCPAVCEYRFPTAMNKVIKERYEYEAEIKQLKEIIAKNKLETDKGYAQAYAIIKDREQQINKIPELLDLLKERQIIYNANLIGQEIFIYPTTESSPIVFNLGNKNDK